MRSTIVSTLALSAFLGLAAPASAQDAPYRTVTSVILVPDLDADLSNTYLTVVDDDGKEEFWDVLSFADPNDVAFTSLSINGDFQFSIKAAIAPFAITVTDDDGVQVTVDGTTWQTDAKYHAFADSTAEQRGFLAELAQEYKAYGTMQEIVPTVVYPDSEEEEEEAEEDGAFGLGDGAFGLMRMTAAPQPPPTPAGQATDRQLCEQDITGVLGAKPEDCEGALDEYKCCIWEMYVDACVRVRYCEKQSGLTYLLCMAGITVVNGVDTTACVVGLPIPGA